MSRTEAERPPAAPARTPGSTGTARTPASSSRRFSRRRWSQRWRRWRGLVAALVVLALVLAGVWAVYFSALLAVDRLEVVGTSTLDPAAIAATADVPVGGPLATADLDAARLRVGALAQVRSVEVTRQWPHTVVISLTERTPVAAVTLGGELRGLDQDGVVLDALPTKDPAATALPTVEAGREVTSAAMAEAAHVVAALPADLAARVDHVEVATIDQISLELGDGRVVRWGSAQDSATKAEVLAALLLQPRAATYDVSVPSLPTTAG